MQGSLDFVPEGNLEACIRIVILETFLRPESGG